MKKKRKHSMNNERGKTEREREREIGRLTFDVPKSAMRNTYRGKLITTRETKRERIE
jgi:hypothetical protein